MQWLNWLYQVIEVRKLGVAEFSSTYFMMADSSIKKRR